MCEEKTCDLTTVANCIAALHQTAPGTIGDMLNFRVLEEDCKNGTCTLICSTESWMRNSFGTLHGGMCATILDQAMGFLARSQMTEPGISPTIQICVNYHKPLMPGKDVLIKVNVVSKTRNLISMTAEASSTTDPNRICLSASGTSFFKQMA